MRRWVKNIFTRGEAPSPRPGATPVVAPEETTPQPEEGPFFALDETVVYQPLTHFCKHCSRIILDARNPHETGLGTVRLEFWQRFGLGTVLRLATTTNCRLFKSFFDPKSIRVERLRREDQYDDSSIALGFTGELRRSHQPHPTREAPSVRTKSGVLHGDITTMIKYAHEFTSPSWYGLFHIPESKCFRTKWII